jgi:hypothetical protein
MKKLLVLTLTLASFGFFGFGSENTAVKGATLTNATPQIRVRIGPQRHRGWRNRDFRNNSGFRTVRQTRIVRHGYATYRETYLIRYFGNGRTDTQLISRERIG